MFNKAIIMGRLTADPELRQTPSGLPVTSFRVAVDRPYSKGAEKQTDFLDVVAWRQSAEFVCRYFSKGKMIIVEGSIQVRDYTDKEGNKRRAWEIVADNVKFGESKSASGGGGYDRQPLPTDEYAPPAASAPAAQPAMPAAYSSGSVEDFAEIDDDGDLPF